MLTVIDSESKGGSDDRPHHLGAPVEGEFFPLETAAHGKGESNGWVDVSSYECKR